MSKNKGVRRSGRLLCLLAALAVLCAGYAVVSRVTQKEAVIETGGSFAVAEISPDEITSIAWQHEGETLSISREDGGEWRLDGIEGFPLRQDLAEEIAENIASLEATHSVTGGADPADYGLDAPEETITVQLGSGDTLDYSMGALNEITGEYYLRFSKNEAIYTIASALDSLAPYGRAELLDAPEIPALDGATRLVIAGTDADVEQNYFADSTGMTYTDSYHWFHVGMDGAAQPSDADRVNALLDKISHGAVKRVREKFHVVCTFYRYCLCILHSSVLPLSFRVFPAGLSFWPSLASAWVLCYPLRLWFMFWLFFLASRIQEQQRPAHDQDSQGDQL